MKNMLDKFILLALGLSLFLAAAQAKELSRQFQLIPLPRQIEVVSEKGLTCPDVSYITLEGEGEFPVLSDILDRLPRAANSGKGVFLKLTATGTPESEEGYVLEVTKESIRVQSRSAAGLFYGCQTLAQLMEDSRDFGLIIPSMKITDYPALTYRAVHFDVKHHLDNIRYYYDCIDKLARYKVNAIIWELEDKLAFSRRPEISAPNAISKQEMQALSRYARERHIEISPLVQGLGHASFILKHHWELREDPASDWSFCPSDPRTYELQYDLYRDALEALPDGKYLHIGGDEVSAIGIDERCRATGKSPFELQMIWLRQVCRFALDHGRIPIFWDDMPLKHGGLWGLFWNNYSAEELDKKWNSARLDAAIELFPKECIYMRWNYFDITEPVNERLLEWYSNKGLKVMGATAAAAGDSPIIPRNESRLAEIRGFNRLAFRHHLEGMLTTAWDDGSPHWETVMRGFIAQGEYGWNPEGRSVASYKAAHSQREFGLAAAGGELAFLDDLEKAMFFYDSALIESGNRNPAYQCADFTLISLPDASRPGTWSAKYEENVKQAHTEMERYARVASLLGEAQHHARRNRYTLDVYEQVNHLQIFPSRLLVGLSRYDKAPTEASRTEAAEELRRLCASFYEMRRRLEDVYGKTRFLSMPDGYIAGSNHPKNMAARTFDNDWMFLYEQPMVKRIAEWLNKPSE